jgi:hypothetical protein
LLSSMTRTLSPESFGLPFVIVLCMEFKNLEA